MADPLYRKGGGGGRTSGKEGVALWLLFSLQFLLGTNSGLTFLHLKTALKNTYSLPITVVAHDPSYRSWVAVLLFLFQSKQ